MSTHRIMAYNYLSDDIMNARDVSSENAEFPSDNLYDEPRRGKVWRSAGYWNITSTNNTIIFRETTLVNLTATIVVGEYSSDTSFFVAVKAALEDAGASTYTVSRETSTNKIQIVSNGSGGGGIFELIWTNASSTAYAILGFNNAVDDSASLTYVADLLKLHTSEWHEWDFGLPTNPKAFLLIDQRNTPMTISPTSTVKLQGNTTNNWTTQEYSATIDYHEELMFKFAGVSDDGLHTGPLRFWRVLIEDTDNGFGYVQIGAIYLGDSFIPSRGGIQFPLDVDYIDRTTVTLSESGVSFANRRPKSELYQLDIFGLDIASKEELDWIFNRVGISEPFFIAIDPDAAQASFAERLTKYVRFESAPRWRLISPQHYGMTASVSEQL